jgi:hypothetical protein
MLNAKFYGYAGRIAGVILTFIFDENISMKEVNALKGIACKKILRAEER